MGEGCGGLITFDEWGDWQTNMWSIGVSAQLDFLV